MGSFWDALAHHKRFPQAPRYQPSNGFGNRIGDRKDWRGKLDKAADPIPSSIVGEIPPGLLQHVIAYHELDLALKARRISSRDAPVGE